MTSIGMTIKVKRVKRRWTQEELEIASGINRATISQIENGRVYPSRDVRKKLLDALK